MVQVGGLAINGILLAAGWWTARRLFRQDEHTSRRLAAALLAWAWSVLGMQVLGILAVLNLAGMAAWTGIGIALSLVATRLFPPIDGNDPPQQTSVEGPYSWSAVICLAFLIWVCLEMNFQTLLYPVKVISDGPIYHLYFAVRWWKAGKYFLVAAPFGENAATYFPANGDLWFTWLMASWGGDRLAKVGQAPFLVLSGMATHGIARALGAGRSASLIATAWFLTSTAFLVFSFQANVDTIFIANYLIAAYFYLRFARGEEGLASLILGGLAAGGALGTKSVAIVFVPPLVAIAILAAVRREGSSRERLSRLLVALFYPFILSGFWYLQNALLTGNPIYPLRVEVLGRGILTGWYGPDAMKTSQYYIPIWFWQAFGDIMLAVLDPRLAPVWLLAIAGAWAISRGPGSQNAKWVWLMAFLAVLNVALYWLVIPYRTQQRFMLQALGLAAIPLATLFDRSRIFAALGSILVILHMTTPQAWPIVSRDDRPVPWDLTPVIPNDISPPLSLLSTLGQSLKPNAPPSSMVSLVLILLVGLLSGITAWSWLRRSRPPGLVGLSFPLVTTTALIVVAFVAYSPPRATPQQLFYPPFRQFYLGWMNYDGLTGPSGTRVAYAGTNIPFYLFGTGLRNDVVYVNVDEHRDWLLHQYHREASAHGREVWPNSRPGWDREHPNYAAWLENLEAERIKLLVVTYVNKSEGAHNAADPEDFPIERQWADSHPERFQLVYGGVERDPWFRIYRLVPPR